jgi:hypothetical protein
LTSVNVIPAPTDNYLICFSRNDVNQVTVELADAGGDGANGENSDNRDTGGTGGSGGNFIKGTTPVQPGFTYVMTVGTPGDQITSFSGVGVSITVTQSIPGQSGQEGDTNFETAPANGGKGGSDGDDGRAGPAGLAAVMDNQVTITAEGEVEEVVLEDREPEDRVVLDQEK